MSKLQSWIYRVESILQSLPQVWGEQFKVKVGRAAPLEDAGDRQWLQKQGEKTQSREAELLEGGRKIWIWKQDSFL